MLKKVIGFCLLSQLLALAKSEQRRKYDYILSSQTKNQYYSTEACKDIGGEIAMPKTEFEMNAARHIILSSREPDKPPKCYYIGLIRGGKEYANFTWNRIPDNTTEDPASVMKWKLGEPDFKPMEFCVCIWDNDGEAMDIKCSGRRPYLCQRKVGPPALPPSNERYNREAFNVLSLAESVRNAVWRNSWWLKLNETGLASGSKVAARVGDAHSAGSRNAATAIVVIGVLLALMLLVGVGYYVYKRRIPVIRANRSPRSIRETLERLYGDKQKDPNRRQAL